MLIKDHLIKFVATGGYSGYAPWAPGTWGSVVGLGLFLSLASLSVPLYSVMLVCLTALGIWVSEGAERLFGVKDASPIVIDEIAGILVTYWAIPLALWPLAVGFCLFRCFDIYKPLPRLECLPGGWGIMADDLCAGCLAQLCLRGFMMYN